jgi:hypothetical protein
VERFRWSSVGLRIADVYDAAREAHTRGRNEGVPEFGFGKEAWEAAVLAR